MPDNVDSLQIKINADASKAIQAIDQVTKHLRELAQESGRSAGGMKAINSSMKELATSARDAKKLGNPFANMVNGIKNYKTAMNGVANAGVTINAQSVNFRNMAKSIDALDSSSKSASASFNPLVAGFKLIGKAAEKTVGKLKGFFHSIVRIAMYRAIRSAIKAITQGLSEGTENLYFFSQAVGSNFAPSMDRLASSMLYLKNGFAAMFSPLVEYFTPLIERLVDRLVDAFNWVQKLFAKLTGKTTWNKAVKVQTTYKEAAKDTTKQVKELREELQLMDFDELNNITETQNDNNNAKAVETPKPNPAEMFVIEPTEIEPMKGTLWENIKEWWDGIDFYEIGEKIGTAIREWIEGIDWGEVWKSIKNILKDIWDLLRGLYDGLFPNAGAEDNRRGDEAWGSSSIDDEIAARGDRDEIIARIQEIQQKLNETTKDPLTGENTSSLYAQLYENRLDLFGAGIYAEQFDKDKSFQAYVIYLEELDKLWKAYAEASGTNYSESFSTSLEPGSEGYTAVIDSAEQLGTDAGEAIGEAAEEASEPFLKKLKRVFSGIWNDFKSGKLWNPDTDLQRGNWGGYANGGFPSQGSIFVAGETINQTELVGNINGKTGVASGYEITGIGDAVWSTGNLTNTLLNELISVVRSKDLTISPSAALGRTLTRSQQLYTNQMG